MANLYFLLTDSCNAVNLIITLEFAETTFTTNESTITAWYLVGSVPDHFKWKVWKSFTLDPIENIIAFRKTEESMIPST